MASHSELPAAAHASPEREALFTPDRSQQCAVPTEYCETQPSFAGASTSGNFKVWLNPAITTGHTTDELEALHREFADWFPGPVLIPAGTDVKIMSQDNRGSPAGYSLRNTQVRVLKHLAADPRVVTILLPDEKNADKGETLLVLHSILIDPAEQKEKTMQQQKKIEDLLAMLPQSSAAVARTQFTVIGFNEFVCGSKAEQEFWICLNHSEPLHIKAGQMPMHLPMNLNSCRSHARGLKWNQLDYQKPLTGTEIQNEALALALLEKVDFTQEEWDKFNVSDLLYNSYIKADACYFTPASHELCVIHVQYSGLQPESSQVERATVRMTQSIEVRAHQDKCRPCHVCIASLGLHWKKTGAGFKNRKPETGAKIDNMALAEALQQRLGSTQEKSFDFTRAEVDLFKIPDLAHDSYIKVGENFFQTSVNCGYCTMFRWKQGYGKQYIGQKCTAVKALCSRAQHDCTSKLSLDDGLQRRFAFVVGNSQFSSLAPLPSAIKDATDIACRLKDLGFWVHKDGPLKDQTKGEMEEEVRAWTRSLPENAQALVFLSGHGIELLGEQYFVSKDFVSKEDVSKDYSQKDLATIVDMAKETCVTLRWILTCVNSVLEEDGLIMSFWDCCRDDALKKADTPYIYRSGGVGGDSMIRKMHKMKNEQAQTQVNSASTISVFASSSASKAFCKTGKNGYLTHALLEWWKHPTIASLNIGDPKVRELVDNSVSVSTSANQRPTWEGSGATNFSFKENDGNQSILLCVKSLNPTIPLTSEEVEEDIVLTPEPNWEKLPVPGLPVPPYRILFIAANNTRDAQLGIEKEVTEMELNFHANNTKIAWGHHNVFFTRTHFASTEDLAKLLELHDPVILHFACHGTKSALSLFEHDVDAVKFTDFIAKWTASGKRLQLIVANTCHSNHLIQALREHVDFAIGHDGPVRDTDAQDFACVLYRYLGSCEFLELGFKGANMGKSYFITGRKNAQKFKLQNRIGNTDLERFFEELELGQFREDIKRLLRVETLNNLKLAYERGCLEKWEPEEMCAWAKDCLLEAVARLVSFEAIPRLVLPNQKQSEEQLSQAGTPLQVSPRSPEVVCMYNTGISEDLGQHVKKLLGQFDLYYEFYAPNSTDDSTELSAEATFGVPTEFSGHWTLCMLIWSAFLSRSNISKENADNWKRCLQDSPKQEDLLPEIDRLIKADKVMGHAMLDQIKLIVEKDEYRFSRPVAAIAVIDCMVQEYLAEGEKLEWTANVVKPWYDSRELKTEDVLRRANIFLRKSINGIKILLKAFETGSYVVFMTMKPVASVLLFQHLELRKLGCMQAVKAASSSAAGAAGASLPSLYGFDLFASSGGRVSHAADADRSAPYMPAIIQGLRCLTHLRDAEWEMIGSVRTARQLFQADLSPVFGQVPVQVIATVAAPVVGAPVDRMLVKQAISRAVEADKVRKEWEVMRQTLNHCRDSDLSLTQHCPALLQRLIGTSSGNRGGGVRGGGGGAGKGGGLVEGGEGQRGGIS